MDIINKVLNLEGKTVIVALEHGTMFNVLPELVDTGDVIEKILSAGADGIITSYGIARKYRSILSGTKVIMRVDGGSCQLSKNLDFELLYTVEDAVNNNASGIICMGFSGGHQKDTLKNVARLSVECDKAGVPLMAEMLPGGFSDDIPKTVDNVKMMSRIGAELGAHIVKTAFVGDAEGFKKVVDGCPSPVVILGGSRSEDHEEFFEDLETALSVGAAGVVVGRNVWQHKDAGKFTSALVELVHKRKSIRDSVELLRCC